MGAVKRTHKQARQNQTAYKFAMRYPDKYAEILREVMLEIAPAVSEVAKEVLIALKATLEARQEELDDLILNGTSPKEPVGITSAHVDRSIFPECVWEKLEAHDERD